MGRRGHKKRALHKKKKDIWTILLAVPFQPSYLLVREFLSPSLSARSRFYAPFVSAMPMPGFSTLSTSAVLVPSLFALFTSVVFMPRLSSPSASIMLVSRLSALYPSALPISGLFA